MLETFKHKIFYLWITLATLSQQGFQALQLSTIHELYKKIKKIVSRSLAEHDTMCSDIN